MISPVFNVRDVAVSMDFYISKLGFKDTGTLPGPDGKTIFGMVQLGESSVMLDGTSYNEHEVEPRGLGVVLHVALSPEQDIDALYADLKGKGVTITEEIEDKYWGERMFTVKDPDGFHLSFAKQTREMSMEEMAELSSQGST
jgi:PhnB protein